MSITRFFCEYEMEASLISFACKTDMSDCMGTGSCWGRSKPCEALASAKQQRSHILQKQILKSDIFDEKNYSRLSLI